MKKKEKKFIRRDSKLQLEIYFYLFWQNARATVTTIFSNIELKNKTRAKLRGPEI